MSPRTATAAFACLLSVCSAAAASIVDQVAAVVDGRVITRSELDEFAATRSRLAPSQARTSPREVLEVMIENALIEREASRSGISVSDE
ncbi:MAG: hypothetical protein HY900_14315, partial [Deltaproteobacteria bacterium]|nr:hypothetical protein [Deltaproteobacteria bacterium]